MKLRKLTLALAIIICGWAFADNFVTITFKDGTTTKKSVTPASETLSFNAALNALVFSDGTEYSFDNIDHIGFSYETPAEESDEIYVTWNGTDEPTVTCSAPDVTYTVSGGDVTFTNTNTDTEYTYILAGKSDAGSFTLIADYKSTIQLNGLNLKSALEEALNIKCGKRIALKLVDGTTNTLEDCTTDNGQKAALYCKGHLEVSGAGTLNLKGNIKHALSTKEYLQLKKSAGTINVTSAVSDGIHAGQYFLMNGGTVNISGIGDDGIQAEVTDDNTDEENGQMIINGGTLNITTTADDVAALKSDSLMTINGGTFNITCTGAADKAFKSDTDMIINDGTITINNSGTGLTTDTSSTTTNDEDDGSETAKGFSTDNNLYIVGGNITIEMTGAGGKGMKSDANIYIGDEATGNGPTLSVKTTGAAYSSSSTGGNTNPWNGPGGGGGWGGGGGGNPGGGGGAGGESTGSDAKAIKCMGSYYQYGGDIYVETAQNGAEGIESKASTTTAMNFNGGNLFMKVCDDCINSAGEINFNGANVICYSTGNDAIDSNYAKTGAITITDGVVICFSQKGGAEMGIDADNMSYVKITGGTLVAGGGSQGSGGGTSGSFASGSTYGSCWSSTVSYTANTYYSIVCNSKNIITWLQPCTLSSSYNCYASSSFTSGVTSYIYQGNTAPTSGTASSFHSSVGSTSAPMLWIGSDITSGTSKGSFTAK